MLGCASHPLCTRWKWDGRGRRVSLWSNIVFKGYGVGDVLSVVVVREERASGKRQITLTEMIGNAEQTDRTACQWWIRIVHSINQRLPSESVTRAAPMAPAQVMHACNPQRRPAWTWSNIAGNQHMHQHMATLIQQHLLLLVSALFDGSRLIFAPGPMGFCPASPLSNALLETMR